MEPKPTKPNPNRFAYRYEGFVYESSTKKYNDVELHIPEDVFLVLATLAHEEDITINQLVNQILRHYIEEKEA